MSAEPHRPARILLVEDNPDDVRLAVRAFQASQVAHPLDVVGDGVEALAYLRREGIYADKPLPGLILLDLNLPRLDGRELLAAIKADTRLMRIPVVVLTTSTVGEDVQTSYRLHASCFITKPVSFEEFTAVVRAIDAFWLSVATLPQQEAS